MSSRLSPFGLAESRASLPRSLRMADLYFDHDQLFKELIREFFADFLNLFFSDWARRFDLTQPVEWPQTELFPKPPDGPRHVLDLVAKVKANQQPQPGPETEPDSWLALIHIEIESTDRTTGITPRLPKYWRHLTEELSLPALPIVVYLRVGLNGIGEEVIQEWFMDYPVNTFRYLYVGLPGLNAEDYRHGDNWLGVALSALMKCPKESIVEWGAEALRRISEAPLPERQLYLLGECVEGYLPIPQDEKDRFRDILNQTATGRVPLMNKTRYMLAREEIAQVREEIAQVREEAAHAREEAAQARIQSIELLEAILTTRFGALSPESMERLRQLSADQLTQIAVAMLSAATLAELGL